MKSIYKNWFLLSIIAILIFSIFVRFVNYENRWGFAYDQAYDAIVARYAYENGKLPLLGRFSSAGPFQTGGEWFWIIMLGIMIYPNSILSPWVFLTLIYVLFILLIIILGKEIVDEKFGIIAGILTAVSSAQVAQGNNLTNQSPQAFVSLFAVWASIRFIRNKELRYLFLLGLSVGLAASIHLQGVALFMLVLFTLIVSKKVNFKSIFIILISLGIPWIPVLIVDIQNNFFNIRNMFQYYIYDQHKISFDVLNRRWLTYLGIFWPTAWSLVSGGTPILIYPTIASAVFLVIKKLKDNKFSKEWITLIISFISMIGLLRYVRTPLFDSYLVFLHPFIILSTAGIIYLIIKNNKYLGALIFLLFVIGSLGKTYSEIKAASNDTYKTVKEIDAKLSKNKRNKLYAVYDYKYKISSTSLPLVLYLYTNKKIDDKGDKIGVINSTNSSTITYPVLVKDVRGINVVDLGDKSYENLKKEGWIVVNPSYVFKETEEWYKK